MDKNFLNRVYCAARYKDWDLLGGIEFKNKVLKIIDSIPDEQIKFVMYYRYICGDKFDLIAKKMGVTYQYVWKLHKNGVQTFDKLFENAYNYK